MSAICVVELLVLKFICNNSKNDEDIIDWSSFNINIPFGGCSPVLIKKSNAEIKYANISIWQSHTMLHTLKAHHPAISLASRTH